MFSAADLRSDVIFQARCFSPPLMRNGAFLKELNSVLMYCAVMDGGERDYNSILG